MSDDEEDEINDGKPYNTSCISSCEKDLHSETKEDGVNGGYLSSDQSNGVQNRLDSSTFVDPSSHDSEISGQIDKPNDVDTRLAVRENTFVTNDAPLTTNLSASVHDYYGGHQSVTSQANMLLENFPPTTLEVRLSRHRRLDFDRIKTELTMSRRGVLIMQALRWVS